MSVTVSEKYGDAVPDVFPVELAPIVYCDPIPNETVYAVPEDIPAVATSAGPIQRTAAPANAQAATSTTTTIHFPPPTTTNPPPGVPDGGQWITIKYMGGGTWAICGVLSIIGCVLFFLPVGAFALCCPCDEKDAYLVDNHLYNHKGKYIGSAKRYKRAIHRHQRRY